MQGGLPFWLIVRNYLVYSFLLYVIIGFLYPFINSVHFNIIAFNATFMFVLTALSGILLAITATGKHTYFMLALAGSMFFKLIFSLGYLYLMVSRNKDEVVLIVLSFFFFYFLFNGFEVFQLIHKLRPHFKRKQTSENG